MSRILATAERAGFARRPQQTLVGANRLQAFMVTINNPTGDEKEFFSDMEDAENLDAMQDELPLRFGVGQLERVTTPHLQCYFVLHSQRTMSSIKNAEWGDGDEDEVVKPFARGHFERRRGTHLQAFQYCRKDESRVEGDDAFQFQFGTPPNQGRAGVRRVTVADHVANNINDGQSIQMVQDEYPGFVMMHRNRVVDQYMRRKGKRNLDANKDNCWIFYGPPGTGKTTTANLRFPDAYHGVWPTGGRWWWPDYEGEDAVIFDEFRHNISIQQMMKLLDISNMTIEYKGGNRQMVASNVVITTNIDPAEWYPNVEDKGALQRRIRQYCRIIKFEEGHAYPNFVYAETEESRNSTFEFVEYVAPDFGV